MRCAVNSTPEALSDAQCKTQQFLEGLQSTDDKRNGETYFYNTVGHRFKSRV